MTNKKKKRSDKTRAFIRYSSLGFEMMAIIALGTFLGYKIDQWMENAFKGFTLGFMVFFVIVAVIYGTKNLLK